MKSFRSHLILSHLLPLIIVLPLLGAIFVIIIESQVLLTNVADDLRRAAALVAVQAAAEPTVWQDDAQGRAFVAQLNDSLQREVILLRPDGSLFAARPVSNTSELQPLTAADLATLRAGQAWATATRQYLALHPEINVIIWAWCAQMATSDASIIQNYLNLMDDLESDFPNVKFVYMTGKTIGAPWGDGDTWAYCHYKRAKEIREHCLKNNRILYDFADIESWDPDGNWYGDKLVTANCDYDSDGDNHQDRNWALDWQNAHPGEWYDCTAPHTQTLNANVKAYAAWWLWARLAGWDGK